ncbi:MAG: glycosyltransferase [Kastovskya adunca ATA6-11-RM4]|jgi:spore maturation protein CgeB|nr:glycosyltransferase [Kastovskya adunca ATA6-11-RM4]
MRIVLFYHSLLSDWNHGNAHFLRGVVSELRSRHYDVSVYEPKDAWSLQNLLAEHGEEPIQGFYSAYPGLDSIRYDLNALNLDQVLDDADLVIVHEWSDRTLVRRLGEHRHKVGGYRLLFHDTHHRSVSDKASMAAYDLSNYDGVLAYGNVIRDIYLTEGWTQQAWTWHEAADTRLFHPEVGENSKSLGDLVWIGNWGDEERTAELYEFLIEPVKALGIKARVHGVRYPEEAIASLSSAGIEYAGWLPNYEVPQVFSRFKVTVHIPRCPYVKALPGIPTIRVFEALACGIPLISAPWEDIEGLFTPGKDFLIAHTGEEMQRHLNTLLQDDQMRNEIAQHGHQTILSRHTCAHRVDELLNIYVELEGSEAVETSSKL